MQAAAVLVIGWRDDACRLRKAVPKCLAEVSRDTSASSALRHWCRSVLGPKCPGAEVSRVTLQGLVCGANLWFDGFPYPVNPGRPEWSKVQTRGKPLVATAQAKYASAGE